MSGLRKVDAARVNFYPFELLRNEFGAASFKSQVVSIVATSTPPARHNRVEIRFSRSAGHYGYQEKTACLFPPFSAWIYLRGVRVGISLAFFLLMG